MISKFIKIKNIGRWRDFSATGDITLDKVNIIYGENGQGKTTLVSVLRSLVLNKPELIKERKTFGVGDKQYVELLLQGNENLKFQNGNWSNWHDNLKHVEIFDEFFINDNIYTGLEIQSENQKCLYQFAIGEEGVGLVKEIEELKQDLAKKHSELESLKNNLLTLTKRHFSEEEYIAISKDEEIEKRIQEKEREINIAKASDEIKIKASLNEIQPISLPFDLSNLKILLSKSLDTISEDALSKTKQHINNLTKDNLIKVLKGNAESWIHQGLLILENINDNKCPFCQQDLASAEVTIKSYQQYFNQEYRKIKEDVEEYLKQIEGLNIEQLLNRIKNNVLENNALLEFWNRFLESKELGEIRDFEKHSRQIFQYFGEVKLAIENKSKSVLTPINSPCLEELSNSIEAFNKEIENYNVFIKELNLQIDKLKRSQPNIEKLKTELEKLNIKKERFQPENNDLCEKSKTIKKEIEEKKKLVNEKKETLNTAISQKVKKYGEETNGILEKFGVPFKIEKAQQRYRGKGEEPYLEYSLKIGNYEVNPLEKTKYVLSSGDRNAFALAFFLAKIHIDRNIANKIIIFDDPISSFDTNRKRRTIEFIRKISKEAKQTILLTHLNTFAFELYDSLKDIRIIPKCLQVINGELKEWNINEEKKHPFF